MHRAIMKLVGSWESWKQQSDDEVGDRSLSAKDTDGRQCNLGCREEATSNYAPACYIFICASLFPACIVARYYSIIARRKNHGSRARARAQTPQYNANTDDPIYIIAKTYSSSIREGGKSCNSSAIIRQSEATRLRIYECDAINIPSAS